MIRLLGERLLKHVINVVAVWLVACTLSVSGLYWYATSTPSEPVLTKADVVSMNRGFTDPFARGLDLKPDHPWDGIQVEGGILRGALRRSFLVHFSMPGDEPSTARDAEYECVVAQSGRLALADIVEVFVRKSPAGSREVLLLAYCADIEQPRVTVTVKIRCFRSSDTLALTAADCQLLSR